jgi:HD-GYP domain-containing protein (c-di-GMP phosphodiesterase class II)
MTRKTIRPPSGTEKRLSDRVSLPTLSDWRANKVPPEQIRKVAECLGLGPDALAMVIKHLDNDAWRTPGKNQLAEQRLVIFDQICETYAALAAKCGWGSDFIEDSSRAIIPFIDLSERACYTTYGHQYRSMQFAEIIMEAYNTQEDKHPTEYGQISGVEQNMILLGILIHDLGKAAIDPEILSTPGRLSPAEERKMQQHPVFGKQMLDVIFERLTGSAILAARLVADVTYSHHEFYAGGPKGYPTRKPTRDMHIGVRVAGLADSFDAMFAVRVFRPCKSYATVLSILREESYGQFNGQLVQLFTEDRYDPLLKDRFFDIIRNSGGKP